MRSIYGCLLAVLCLSLTLPSQAQKTVRIIVTSVSTNIGDCDADVFTSNDSDPIWWWSVNGSYEGCFETSCNGCTASNLNREVYNASYNCAADFPSSLSLGFSGCENDGAACSDIWLTFTGICDGDVGSNTAGSRTDQVAIPQGNGTYDAGTFSVTSSSGTFGGCVGQFTYSAVVQVSGSFLASSDNDDICDATDLGGGSPISAGTSVDYPNQSNRCASKQPGEPQVNNVLHDGSLLRDVVSVWYTFETDDLDGGNACLQAVFSSGNLDGHLTLYRAAGSCSSFNNLTMVTEGGLAGGGNDLTTLNDDIFTANIQPFTRYYIQVIGNAQDLPGLYNAHLGEFDLNITLSAVPSNDDFCQAQNLAGSGLLNGGTYISLIGESNSCATKQSGEPQVNNILHDGSAFRDLQSVWYYFETGDLSGNAACLDVVANSNELDVHLTLFRATGSCASFGNLVQVAEGGLAGGGNDLTTLNDDIFVTSIQPNTRYYLQVIGNAQDLPGLYDAHYGSFDLFVSLSTITANDAFCGAQALSAGDFPLQQTLILENESNRCGSEQDGEPQVDNILHDASAFRDLKSLWYYLETPSHLPAENCLSVGMVSLNSTIDGHITIYESTGSCNSFNNITQVAEGGLAGGGNDLTTLDDYASAYNLLPSTRYYIQIIGNAQDLPGLYNAHQGEYDLTIALSTQPVNDNLCQATDLGSGLAFSSDATVVLQNESNRCAGKEAGEPKVNNILHDASAFRDCQSVWYKLTTDDLDGGEPASIRVAVRSINGTIDAHVAIYKSTGACSFSALEEVAEGGLLGGGNDLTTKDDDAVALGISPNTTYYIQVFGNAQDLPGLYNAHQGEFDLTVSVFTRPDNDDICEAEYLGNFGLSQNIFLPEQSSYNATTENGEPNTFSTFYEVASVWYSFAISPDPQLAPNSLTATVTSVQDIDAHVAIYKGGCGDFNKLDLIAEGGLPGTGLNDLLTKDDDVTIYCTEPNARYFIQVTGWEIALQNNHHGIFDLRVTTAADARPPHDNLADAIDLVPNAGATSFNSTCATLEDNEPVTQENELLFDISPSNTVWHRFETPASSVNSVRATISTDHGGTSFDTEITLWYSRDGSADPQDMVQVAYSDDIQLLINTNSRVEADELAPEAIYYIQVDGDDEGDFGPYQISLALSDGSPLPPGPVYHHYYYAQPGDDITTKKYDNALLMNLVPGFRNTVRRNGQDATWDFSMINAPLPFNNRFYEADGFLDGLVYTALCELSCPTDCQSDCGTSNPLDPCYSACLIECGFACLDDWLQFNLAYTNQDDIRLGQTTLANPREIFIKSESALVAGAIGFDLQSGPLDLPVLAPYTERDQLYDFPIMWTKSHTSESNWTMDLSILNNQGNLIIAADRLRTAEVKGYGTLKVRGNTYRNAIKLRSEVLTDFTIRVDPDLLIETETLPHILLPEGKVYYDWFVPGYEIPIVTVVATINNGNEFFWAYKYWDDEYRDDPFARFTVHRPSAPLHLPDGTIKVGFVDASTGAVRYAWDFGDGATSEERDPVHHYTLPGTYQVALMIFDEHGVSDRAVQTIHLYDNHSADAIDAAVQDAFQFDQAQLDDLVSAGIRIFPNPFHDGFRLELPLTDRQEAKISLWNATGSLVGILMDETVEGPGFHQTFDLSGWNLPKGLYFAAVQLGDQMHVIKLTKQ